MFSSIRPPTSVGHSRRDRAVEVRRRTGPAGRPCRRIWSGSRLETLEDRCLLSSVSGISEFPVPGVGDGSQAITTGPDGNVWFTEQANDAIGMINPTTHAVSSFAIPTANAAPFGIAAGPDGNLWFTEYGTDKIGLINPTTHAISEFLLSTANARPYAITAGPDGNL